MYEQDCDAIIEIDPSLARVLVLSPEAQDWIEVHVTLEQVETWTGDILEIAPHYIGDLIAGMLSDGLKISTAHGHSIERRAQCGNMFFMTYMSLN
jgi:hypothetical protein